MKKILCVDDSKTNLLILEAFFEDKQSMYEVILVTSGEEAIDVLSRESIDLILLDIMMPEMDGYETASDIGLNKKTKDIPIIFLTSKKDQGTITKCYEVGGVDYLQKPYNNEELFARINFHIEIQESKKIIEQEKALSQEILDMQDNLIFLSNGNNVIRVNKKVLDFFNLDTYEDFILRYGCLCDLFLEKDGYYSIKKEDCNNLWIDDIMKHSNNKECLVLINNEKDDIKNSFTISINKFENKYFISLTDVTSLAEESYENELAANIDVLTKVPNRLKFNKEFANTVNLAKDNESFSLILFDIDNFKYINDTYGHLVGDDVLVKLSSLIKTHTRNSDLLARWGGEEFIILLHGVEIEKAIDIAEYLRSIIEVEHFDEINNITCSFGVSQYKKGDDLNSILKRIDEALYEAKEGGKNKVCNI